MQHDPSPIGELNPREFSDAWRAAWWGLLWPFLLPAFLLMRAVPLTPGEQNRVLREQEKRIKEQAADIERLLGEVEDRGHRFPPDRSDRKTNRR